MVSDLTALREAVHAEAAAAESLRGSLGRIRAASETLDVRALAAAVEEARERAEGLNRAGTVRVRLAAETARGAGLAKDATVWTLVRESGDRTLEEAARCLSAGLDRLSREVGVQGLCARYGQQAFSRLVELRKNAGGTAPSYGPTGRLHDGRARPGRRV